MKKDDLMYLTVAPAEDIRRDVRKNLPWIISLLAVTFVYVLISSALIRAYENHWSFLHACYFTVINMTTVGFGDVLPLTHGGKIIAGVNALVGLLFFGMLVAVLALALQPSGWSATLTPSESSNSPESSESSKISEQPMTVENGVAEFLEGLAKIVRIAENRDEVVSREGCAKIEIITDGRHPHFVRVYVDVRAG